MMLVVVFRINHIGTLLNPCKKSAHLAGGCLPVIVKAHHHITLYIVKACHKRRMLSKVPCKIDSRDVIIFPAQSGDHTEGVIRRGIIHQHDLVFIIFQCLHGILDFLNHARQCLRGTIAGNHKTDHLH